MKAGDTIAVVNTTFAWSMDPGVPSGERVSLTLFGDQPVDRIATNQRRQCGRILADTVPGLLRTVAEYMEQEDVDTLDDLADLLRAARDGGGA